MRTILTPEEIRRRYGESIPHRALTNGSRRERTMHPLPNCEEAVIEDSKFVSYALDPQSGRGQHKARVFESVLGFNLSNWEQLKQAILDALPYRPATLTSETVFGKKYEVLVLITGANGRTADVVTIWQFDRLPDGVQFADVPRLVTLYIP